MEDSSKVIVQEDFSFGPHDLQTLTVYNPVGSSHNEDGYFIIYIHGGAWRDPLITPSSILPTLTTLLTPTPSTLTPTPFTQNIRALASLSYRLSPHPSFPQPPPPTTPTSTYRSAIHPAHLLDVLSGITFLQKRYGFGSRYILAGHSCGATLALQTLMREQLLSASDLELDAVKAFAEPEVIVGMAGIYDLRLLRDKNSHPAYQEFLAGAFGTDEEVWHAVSPALALPLSPSAWKEGKLLVLASSLGDELVDPSQIEAMGVSAGTWKGGGERGVDAKVEVKVWEGMLDMGHDEIWSEGKRLAAVLEKALGEFFGGKGAQS